MSERTAGTVHFRTCNLCEAMCGLALTVENGKVTSTRGDDDDPFSRGHICPKGPAMAELVEDPDRLRRPVKRTATGWQEISWDEAFELAAAGLGKVQAAHGRDAVGVYAGNPSVHGHGAALYGAAFFKALRTRNRFDANSLDTNPKLLSCLRMYGDPSAIPIPDVDRTDYFLMIGANPAASNGSLMTLGDVRGRFAELKRRGARVVVVDPRRTETASTWADEHHFIRPGGDAAFLLALVHVLFAEKLVASAIIAEQATGAAELERLAARFPPERVAGAVGIAADTIRRLARDLAAAKRACVYGRVGACQNEHGVVASWLIDALNVLTGNFGREGGVCFPESAIEITGLVRKLGIDRTGRWHSRVRKAPELAGQLPAAVMAEEMETPGEGQIRAMVTIAGNPVLSAPNGERISCAMAKLDFCVAIDPYVNETTRHAHVILPPVPALMRSHYDVIFNALAVRNVAKWSPPVLPKDPDGKEDWEILYELGMRLGGLRLGSRLVEEPVRLAWRLFGWKLSPDRLLDLLLRVGRYRLSVTKLRAAPHGVDLGPMRAGWKRRMRTKTGKVDLAPESLVADAARVDAWLDRPRDGLVLIGRRHLRSNNSWMHNLRSLTKGPDRSALLIHPDDAAARKIADGQSVRVGSRVGQVEARAQISDEVMPGVVSLPHGFGHAAVRATLKVAGEVRGPNMNALTDDALLDPLSGTAILNGVPVTVDAL